MLKHNVDSLSNPSEQDAQNQHFCLIKPKLKKLLFIVNYGINKKQYFILPDKNLVYNYK
jgi:hypothetical protein